ncbi:COX15/CtaA family protein [Rheinheimera baltica]|uniref:COX15/CtaA family protein n=1 Tax=Rheinheimera baltica TaxID=67576 RepID=A0ABT9I0A6_9GAMM|nr:COX15/CtaA family protein [Rheinheimera baltica]MDP5136822.1 COX15/CtaA family protein [Rheinheimera baltica]MDP5142262.1 COX15/CtaA family protein [Rheinheimera baltica]
MKKQQWLATIAIFLTMGVILLGAYTRLTDAGLGCPDWPGCYGFLKVPHQEHHIEAAQQAFPERPLEPHKAWNEMIHRYFAGSLGLLIAAIFFSALFRRQSPKMLPGILLALVVFQAALGMWTVTLNLLPLVVMGHLLGGFSLLCLLAVHWLTLHPQHQVQEPELRSLKPLAALAVMVLVGQIALGGWTAANYAALACIDLPVCEAGWIDRLNVSEAFDLHLGHDDYEYGVMSAEARQTVHVFHRLGAVITVLVLSVFLVKLWRRATSTTMKRLTAAAASLLVVQFSLGVLNVVLHLPLANAVAHNFIAANLLMLLVLIYVQIHRSNALLSKETL